MSIKDHFQCIACYNIEHFNLQRSMKSLLPSFHPQKWTLLNCDDISLKHRSQLKAGIGTITSPFRENCTIYFASPLKEQEPFFFMYPCS